jgi:hypothetical protein
LIGNIPKEKNHDEINTEIGAADGSLDLLIQAESPGKDKEPKSATVPGPRRR